MTDATHQFHRTLSCPAKVNLALSVGSADAANDGRHPIASWMAALTFADTLELTRLDEADESPVTPSHFDIAFEPIEGFDTPVVDWPIDKDLLFRAHQLLQAEVERPLPIEAKLSKRIPPGAGLGGGSGNAAAMLVGGNDLFDLGLSDDALLGLANQLGSDVVFAVHAIRQRRSALVTGFGEGIEPIDRRGKGSTIHLVLVLPPFGCPTGAVYRAFDEMHAGETLAADEPRVRALIGAEHLPQDGPFNDLAEPAQRVQPRLAEALAQLREAMQLPVHVTGSGAAMFMIAPSEITAAPLARKVAALTGLRAVATRTV